MLLGVLRRLIPARAGKTGALPPGGPPLRAHPRACGENDSRRRLIAATPGSSPRVRGKLPFLRLATHASGLIPARAGKTCGGARSLFRRGAHPRACGENAQCSPRGWDRCGSSPRVRGKPEPRDDRRGVGGLIPARAGKTTGRCPRPGSPGAHPRACGENSYPRDLSDRSLGSSPRVRGKLDEPPSPPVLQGLIPARAGKTPG